MPDTSFLPPSVEARIAATRRKRATRQKQERSRLRGVSQVFAADDSVRRLSDDPYEGALEIAASEYGIHVVTVIEPSDEADAADLSLARYVAEQLVVREQLAQSNEPSAQARLKEMPELPFGVMKKRVLSATG